MSNIQETFLNLSAEAKQIFSIIQKRGATTKKDLLDITGFKLTTLNRIIEPLINEQLIVEHSIGESSGGRKPVLYDVNTNKYCSIGIDLSRTYCQVIFVDLKMNILYKIRFKMDDTYTPEKTIEIVSKIISDALIELKIERNTILGVGIGAVGPMDRKSGLLINPINFTSEGWSNVPIKNMISRKVNLPVIIDNGANTAVLAEYFFGIGKSFKNVAYFNCGIGIRTGAINEDNIIRTLNDSEDCFAHMVINVDGEHCTCGNFGCIEAYSSIPSILKKFISALKKGRRTEILKEVVDIDYLDICKAAENDDDLAKEVILNAATHFRVGLTNYINLLNPEVIILSGPLIKHSNLFYETAKEIVYKKYKIRSDNKILFSKEGFLKDEAISIGAAVMVIESFIKNEKL